MFIFEGNQLQAFVKHVETNNLAQALQNHDWVTFAKAYNGSQYYKRHYDTQLQTTKVPAQ